MTIKKETIFYSIIAAVLLAILEGLSFFALNISVKPIQLKLGLPALNSGQPAHPYKSYMYQPGASYWGDRMPPFRSGGNTYDYAMIKGGVVFDEFGHGVLPADVHIARRAKVPGEYRILFLGGSTTFQPWPFLTTELLNRQLGRNIHAISAATGGYTSQENVTDLVTSGSAYDADLIVAYLPVNDIWHAARWPHFKRDYTHFRTAVTREAKAPNVSAPNPDLIVTWPFTIRLVQTLFYNKRMADYIPLVAVNDLVTVKPGPDELGIWIDKESYEGTVAAVIDNIFTMKNYAESRGIKFLLVTQKVFKTTIEADIFITKYVVESIDRIKSSPRLAGVPIVEMNVLFPEPYTDESIQRTRRDFPSAKLDFSQPQSYDTMHFSPSGLYLFASIMAEHIAPVIK
jgi:hypothetical protein